MNVVFWCLTVRRDQPDPESECKMNGTYTDGEAQGTGSMLSHLGNPEAHPEPVDIALWRRAERQRLIADRLAMSSQVRHEHARRMAEELEAIVPQGRDTVVSVYWPFRGEPNLVPWMSTVVQRQMRVALPVVIARNQPLEFREWQPGVPLARGVWNIPFPADGRVAIPTVVIAPLVGFDRAGFRLGYGGGFFDRTLAARSAKPLVIGVGYDNLEIPTIHPQPHDILMDWIVTGNGAPRNIQSTSENVGGHRLERP
jgi:5,10-methenyltetrahydrofolate synthetase